ncbi:MAG TPA: hypothetical protein PKC23_07750 [Candidatus Desulfobacillus sp.]|nr:hypothetical protein [Candidatus Desulfobacillus sp.]
MPTECIRLAASLNRDCQCVSVDRNLLREMLARGTDGADMIRLVEEERPYLFAETTVFLGQASVDRMADIVAAVERVVVLPGWAERALAWAPESARHASAAASVFMGYDFHLGENGPQLIEINTNAGGGLLNAALAQAQFACCREAAFALPGVRHAPSLEQEFVDMFREEWRAERGAAPLERIAIVDEDPPAQFLYPEFLLFQKLFERHGIAAVICDPSELGFAGGRLWRGVERIDLVYNRLTDFGLDAPRNAALRQAWLSGGAVVTPHPRAHALYADKRNLTLLTDAGVLAELGADETTQSVLLSGIPRARRVRRADAEELWARRRQLFFKPAAGFGGRAAYRGDKVTRRVFEDILGGDYVAQDLVPPSQRRLGTDELPVDLKIDLRNYVYRGSVQMVTARLYQGQTTNFRTPGGGFAPVLTLPRAGGSGA